MSEIQYGEDRQGNLPLDASNQGVEKQDAKDVRLNQTGSELRKKWRQLAGGNLEDDFQSDTGYQYQVINPNHGTLAQKEAIIGRKVVPDVNGEVNFSTEEHELICTAMLDELDAEDQWLEQQERNHESRDQ